MTDPLSQDTQSLPDHGAGARIAEALAARGLTLGPAPSAVASYVPALAVPPHAHIVVVSGQIPIKAGHLLATGRVGVEVSLETAIACAECCALNALAALKQTVGTLDRLLQVVKLEGFVACDPGFPDQPKIINGASDLLLELLGEAGRHARAAVGVPALPLNVPVEIAFTFAVTPGE